VRSAAERPSVAAQWIVRLVASLAGLVLLYEFLSGRGNDDAEIQSAEEKRGYYVHDATLTEMGPDGQPKLVVRARDIEQQLSDQSVLLADLKLDYRTEANGLWTVTADRGRMPPDRTSLLLAGDVVVASRDQPNGPVVHTETLSYDTTSNLIQTSDVVNIRFGRNDLRGRGLRANLNTGTLRLESSINGRFHP